MKLNRLIFPMYLNCGKNVMVFILYLIVLIIEVLKYIFMLCYTECCGQVVRTPASYSGSLFLFPCLFQSIIHKFYNSMLLAMSLNKL
jgi:hypothetical protein